jgi:hypothetical protein
VHRNMSADFTDFLETLIDQKINQIKVGYICKIEKIDLNKMLADLQPLLKFSGDKKKYGLIVDIPVICSMGGGFYSRPAYKKGDLVVVLFSGINLDVAVKGQFNSGDDADWDLNSAIILGGIMTDTVSDFSKDGLLIGHKNGTYINVQDSKVVVKTGSSTVTVDGSSVEVDTINVTIKGSSSIKLDGEVEVTKKLTCKDEILANKDITSDTEVIAGVTSVKLTQHKHTTVLGPTIPPVIPS